LKIKKLGTNLIVLFLLEAMLLGHSALAVKGTAVSFSAEEATLAPNLRLSNDTFLDVFNQLRTLTGTDQIKELIGDMESSAQISKQQDGVFKNGIIRFGENLVDSFLPLNALSRLPLWNFFKNPLGNLSKSISGIFAKRAMFIKRKAQEYKNRYEAVAKSKTIKKRNKLIDREVSNALLEFNYYTPIEKWFSDRNMPGTGRFLGQSLLPAVMGPFSRKIARSYKERHKESYLGKRIRTPWLEKLIYQRMQDFFEKRNRPLLGEFLGKFLMPIITEPVLIVSGTIIGSLALVSAAFGFDFSLPAAATGSEIIAFAAAFLPSQIIWYIFSSLQFDFLVPERMSTSFRNALSWDKVIISLMTGSILIPAAFIISYLFLLTPLAFNVLLGAVVVGPFVFKQFWKVYLSKLPSFWLRSTVISGIGAVILLVECQTGALFYVPVFSSIDERASALSETVQSNPVYPKDGPVIIDEGIDKIKPMLDFFNRTGKMKVVSLPRQNETKKELISRGIVPDRIDPAHNFTVLDADGEIAFDYDSGYEIENYSDIHPDIIKLMLLAENPKSLDLLYPEDPGEPEIQNYTVEWKALAGNLTKRLLGQDVHGAASTLFTTAMKASFSKDGTTSGGFDKFNQMFNASLFLNAKDRLKAGEDMVLDFMNIVRLGSGPKTWQGEVRGFSQALDAFFGVSLKEMNSKLEDPRTRAQALKQIATLIVGIRRPVRLTSEKTEEQNILTQRTNDLLEQAFEEGVIVQSIYRQSRGSTPGWNYQKKKKALNLDMGLHRDVTSTLNVLAQEYYEATGIRVSLPDLLNMNIQVSHTNQKKIQSKIADALKRLQTDAEFRNQLFKGYFNNAADIAKVNFSAYIVDKNGRVLVHTDTNSDVQDDLAKNSRKPLASTAKVRVLFHYTKVLTDLYERYAEMSKEELDTDFLKVKNNLSVFVNRHVRANYDSVQKNNKGVFRTLLKAAMGRKFSATEKKFYTNGGLIPIENYSDVFNGKEVTIAQATAQSINIPFVYLMQEMLNFYVEERFGETLSSIKKNPHDKARSKWARDEIGRVIDQAIENEKESIIHRINKFIAFVGESELEGDIDFAIDAYTDTEMQDFLKRQKSWRKGWLRRQIKNGEVTDGANTARILRENTNWLKQRRNKANLAIRIHDVIEKEVFEYDFTPAWGTFGYQYSVLDSLNSGIGKSADSPGALVELMNILINKGVKKNFNELEGITFAANTDFETSLESTDDAADQKVLEPEAAEVILNILETVVTRGTASQAKQAEDLLLPSIKQRGKTGTGGNERIVGVDEVGEPVKTRDNRVAAYMFSIGDNISGIVEGYVEGEDAIQYKFSSALMARIYAKVIVPAFKDYIMQTYYDELTDGLFADQRQLTKAINTIRLDMKSVNFNPEFVIEQLPFLELKTLKQLQRSLRLMPLKKMNATTSKNRSILRNAIKKQLNPETFSDSNDIDARARAYLKNLSPATVEFDAIDELGPAELLVGSGFIKALILPRRFKPHNPPNGIESAI